MSNKWFPTKKEIEKLLDRKIHAFAAQENRNLQLSKEQWLNRYLYTNETKAFFCFFPCELHEWLSKLVDSQGMWRLDNPIVWTPELVKHLEASKDNIVWVFDHWIDRIVE